MKTLKKLAALLLAGTFMLTMLTACSGGGEKSLGAQIVDANIAAMNQWRSPGKPKLTNDAALKDMAKKALDAIDPDTLQVDQTKVPQQQGVTIKIMQTGLTEEIMQATLERLKNMPTPNLSNEEDQETVAENDTITAIGMAYREINGKTYLAQAIEKAEAE